MGPKFGAQQGNEFGSQLGPMSITKLSSNWACQMGPIHCPKFLLPGNYTHGRRSLRKSRGDKNRFPLDREIVLKIAKNSFTVVIVDKGLCNVSAVRFDQE